VFAVARRADIELRDVANDRKWRENRLLVEGLYQKVYRARFHARLASICRAVQY
jgi:hypothetical protein